MNPCVIPKIPYDGQEQDEWIMQVSMPIRTIIKSTC